MKDQENRDGKIPINKFKINHAMPKQSIFQTNPYVINALQQPPLANHNNPVPKLMFY